MTGPPSALILTPHQPHALLHPPITLTRAKHIPTTGSLHVPSALARCPSCVSGHSPHPSHFRSNTPPHYRAPHHCLCPLPCFMPFWLSPPSDTLKCNLLEDRAPIPLSYGLPGTQKTTSRIPGVQRAAERAYG